MTPPPVLVVAKVVTIASRWSMRASVDAVVASSLAAVAAVDADMFLTIPSCRQSSTKLPSVVEIAAETALRS